MGDAVDVPVFGGAIERGIRLESLTSLRFVAALLVFGNHIGDSLVADGAPLNQVLQTGFVGVSFFFVLSGFVLTWAWRPTDSASRFYRRRVARVLPNYLVSWLAALALAVVSGLFVSTGGLIGSLWLVQAWHPDPDVHFAVNPVGWTLSVEAFFYLTFPILIGPLTRLSRQGRCTVMGACVAGSIGWAIIGQVADPHGRHWLVYVFPLARWPEFVLGILLALAVRADEFRRVPLGPVLVIGAGAWALGLALPQSFHVATVTLIPFALVIIAAAHSDLGGNGGGLLHKPLLIRLGEWSFAFYLVHELIIRGATKVFDLNELPGAATAIAVVALLLISVASSGAIARLVERPWEARLRGRSR